MAEIKLFGELSLDDRLYVVGQSDYEILSITEIKRSVLRNLISITTNDGENYELCRGEYIYDEEINSFKLTTDKDTYDQWRRPFIIKEIRRKEEIIVSHQQELEELKAQLPKETIDTE